MNLSEKDILEIGLSHCYFLKAKEKLVLLEQFANFEDFINLSLTDISVIIKRRVQTKTWDVNFLKKLVDISVRDMGAYDIHKTSFNDGDFPAQLREIPDAPATIFYRGNLPNYDSPMMAMVGTRHPTGEGINAALSFAKEFALKRIPIVSGLAYGIDTFSHRACLEADGITIAVLACGPERIYPRSNKSLAVKILENDGCILSEYAPGTEALPYRFPQRNRIISGLSRGILVVEAPKKSGALITADFALEQGRDVFVCKEILNSLQNEGAANLHQDGAVAISSVDDVIKDWSNC